MNYRNDHPDYVTLMVEIGVLTIVSVTVEIRVPRADADNLEIGVDDAINGLDATIIKTSEADAETFNSPDNIETLNQASAEALAEYRVTVTP